MLAPAVIAYVEGADLHLHRVRRMVMTVAER